ncbi:hypothetical protein [Falsiroseomonas sp. E2-1-a20]|uniref:hypothetical protein n=1 Tax=Falsiroseomonas sp. E2-1-a20 TaxID=3239300 RepID=UPI003F305FD7
MSDPLPPQAKPRRRSAEAIAGQRLRGQARRMVADLDALIREVEAACAAQGIGGSLADAEAKGLPLA